MRKLIALLLVLGVAVFSGNFVYAQDANESEAQEQVEDSTAAEEAPVVEEEPAPEPEAMTTTASEGDEAPSGYQVLKKYFIDGDWRFMSFVLICLILGLAFCIERIITLNIATTNTDKLLGSH
jgi:biopolymer transport protein ExbB